MWRRSMSVEAIETSQQALNIRAILERQATHVHAFGRDFKPPAPCLSGQRLTTNRRKE